MFDYSVETELTVEEAVRSVEEALSRRKFGVLWKLDIPVKLLEKGIQLDQEYRVLEVCNPEIPKKVLTRNQKGGYFLPCRVVVTRTAKRGIPGSEWPVRPRSSGLPGRSVKGDRRRGGGGPGGSAG